MKRLLAVLVLFLLVSGVQATSYPFQNAGDATAFSNNTQFCGAYPTWTQNTSGGNSYMDTKACSASTGVMYLIYGSVTTYSAATLLGGTSTSGYPIIFLYDGSKTAMYSYSTNTFGRFRYEIKMVGGAAYIYRDGILVANSSVLASNPAYIGYGISQSFASDLGRAYWDDIVPGASDSTYVIGMPETNAYYLKKDMVNPAASGFYNSSGALMNSNVFPITFSRSNLTGEAVINETITLINVESGTVYGTYYTGTESTGSRSVNFAENLVAANAPYGYYQMKIGSYLSDQIPYIADGASIAWSSKIYSQGETATITYSIDSGGYWAPGTYTYQIKIVDVYGNAVSTQNIAAQAGAVTYSWSTSNTQGVYYAEIIATPIAGGDPLLMNYDYTTLSATFGFIGWVHEDESAAAISGASVAYIEDGISYNGTTNASGYYATGSIFITGADIWSNTSATNYQNQNFSITVMSGHQIQRNITLSKTLHSNTSVVLGGVAREGVLSVDNYTIASGYGRPIASPTCHVTNTTYGESYTVAGNAVGFYSAGNLMAGRIYSVYCSKTGYSDSPIYQKTVVAS